MDAPTPPPAPDPVATAQAQTTSNRETAIANANLNRFDQFTPQGSTTYKVVGTNADGTPKYESTQSYSPGEQKIYDLNTQTRSNLGQIGVDSSARMGALLGTKFDPGTAASDKIFALGSARLDPRFKNEQATLEQQLANKGIGVGTSAYQRAMNQLGQTKNDAYNQLALTGDQQAFSQAVTERNQPFNEIAALMSGSQVSNPTYGAVPTATMANTDVAGIINQGYQNQLSQYNAEQSQGNAMMGGIFGLAGAGIRAAPWSAMAAALPWSDRRLKCDIVKIGTGKHGLPVYKFKYVWDNATEHVGHMADEVEMVAPHAVHEFNGLKAVDYAAI